MLLPRIRPASSPSTPSIPSSLSHRAADCYILSRSRLRRSRSDTSLESPHFSDHPRRMGQDPIDRARGREQGRYVETVDGGCCSAQKGIYRL